MFESNDIVRCCALRVNKKGNVIICVHNEVYCDYRLLVHKIQLTISKGTSLKLQICSETKACYNLLLSKPSFDVPVQHCDSVECFINIKKCKMEGILHLGSGDTSILCCNRCMILPFIFVANLL